MSVVRRPATATDRQSPFAPSQTYLQITDCARAPVVRPATVSAAANAADGRSGLGGGGRCFLLSEASRRRRNDFVTRLTSPSRAARPDRLRPKLNDIQSRQRAAAAAVAVAV